MPAPRAWTKNPAAPAAGRRAAAGSGGQRAACQGSSGACRMRLQSLSPGARAKHAPTTRPSADRAGGDCPGNDGMVTRPWRVQIPPVTAFLLEHKTQMIKERISKGSALTIKTPVARDSRFQCYTNTSNTSPRIRQDTDTTGACGRHGASSQNTPTQTSDDSPAQTTLTGQVSAQGRQLNHPPETDSRRDKHSAHSPWK